MYPLSQCWDLWENFIGHVYFHVLIAGFFIILLMVAADAAAIRPICR